MSQIIAYFVTFIVTLFGCNYTESHNNIYKDEINRGRAIYQTYCITCHNTNPSKPGSIGPDLINPSLWLLYSKVTRGVYPLGYKPKRNTHIMPKMPYLRNDIKSIYHYLNSKLTTNKQSVKL